MKERVATAPLFSLVGSQLVSSVTRAVQRPAGTQSNVHNGDPSRTPHDVPLSTPPSEGKQGEGNQSASRWGGPTINQPELGSQPHF